MSFFGSKNFLLEVAKGNVADHSSVAFIGINPNIGKTLETVWDSGGIFQFPTSGETWEILSDSTDDDGSPVGIGARTVSIIGLDTNYVRQIETVIMNGTSVVTISRTDWFRPRVIVVVSSGSSKVNVGTITLRVSGGGAIRSAILPGNCQSFNGFHTVPLGFTAYLLQYTPTIPKNEDVTIKGIITLEGSSTNVASGDIKVYQSSIAVPFLSNPALSQKTDFHLFAKSTNENIDVKISFELVEIVQDITQNLEELRIF